MKKRLLSLALAALMCVSAFAGCAKGGTSSGPAASEGTNSTASEVAKDEFGADFAGYPIKTDEEVSLYVLAGYDVPDGVSRNDNEWEKEFIEKVGVKINWEEIPAGSDANQAYNLMIAGADLPDIFYYWGVPGVASQLIADKKILALNDKIETYAPAYYSFIKSDDAIDKSVKDDNGDYYGFAFLREDLKLGTYAGPIIREDLLKKAGLEVPETIADWDKVLHAFKDQSLTKYPVSSRNGLSDVLAMFAGAYGVTTGYYVGDDNKIHYGYVEDGMKEALAQINNWYKDGLVDPDFLSNDSPALETKILNSEVGACYSTGGTVAGYVTKLTEMNSTDGWVGAAPAVKNAGETPMFCQGETNNIGIAACITTSCKNVPLALRVLDYGYTKDGMVFYNYGNSSNYELVDGDPVFTEAFNTDPRGAVTMMQTYTAMAGNAPTLNMLATFKGFTELRQACVNTWYIESALKHLMPGSITLTTDESTSIANESTAIDSYVAEMVAKFVLGQESLDGFDAFVEKVKGMGLEHVLEVKQAGYDRYLAR